MLKLLPIYVANVHSAKPIRNMDKINAKAHGIRILKSAEADVLENGSLDYPDILLQELDYPVCSIHSKFAMDKTRQMERDPARHG